MNWPHIARHVATVTTPMNLPSSIFAAKVSILNETNAGQHYA
jgi:hypothetical protein